MTRIILVAAATMLSLGGVQHAAAQAPSVKGLWQQTENDGRVGAWFYFAERNGFWEGRLAKIFAKPGDPIVPNCLKCEGDQKNAPMLGLVIVKQMKQNALKFENGKILDPRSGSLYQAQMELSPDGQKLSVRGYLGISILGQTQIWTRLPDNAMSPTDIPKESTAANVKR
jgi:uncharacterized protein (DUF2147 family)